MSSSKRLVEGAAGRSPPQIKGGLCYRWNCWIDSELPVTGGEQVDQKVFWNMPVLLQFGPACVGKVHFYLPDKGHPHCGLGASSAI